MKTNLLITGGAGFIGSSLIEKIISNTQINIICVDNLNSYYDPKQKRKNIVPFLKNKNFFFYKIDILQVPQLEQIFQKHKIHKIIHLAAMAGVRNSIINPQIYQKVNVEGTLNLLRLSKEYKISQFIFGSTSAIYGNQTKTPFSESDPCNQPISPYATTKKAAELLCYTNAYLYKIKTTVLRFFTVYGPKGRPDMAPYLFTKAILENNNIEKFGNGETKRDYTYIDDIVYGIIKTLKNPFNFEIINLGNNHPISLNQFINVLEKIIGNKAKIINKSIPLGDVQVTYADINKAKKLLSWQPKIDIVCGLKKFIKWYQQTNDK